MQLQERPTSERVIALDAMRGIAAVLVLVYHLRCLVRTSPPRWYLRPLFSGHQSVVLFFVLSGYVLSLAYWQRRPLPYGRFFIRRIFRIWVPYAAALLLATAGAWRFGNAHLHLTPWFNDTWHTPITPKLFISQLLMKGTPELNTAFWSLRYEMEMSIVFPAIGWMLLRLKPTGGTAVGIGLSFAGVWLRSASLLWASCFVLGGALAGMRIWIARSYAEASPIIRYLLLLGSCCLYFTSNDQLTTAGAFGLLAIAPNSRCARWLNTALPEYLGRISYSLYLVHGTILFALVMLLYGKLPTGFLIALIIVASFIASHFFCVFIEEPSTKLGRSVTRVERTRRNQIRAFETVN